MKNVRTAVVVFLGLGILMLGCMTRADEKRRHEPLHRAIEELRAARDHLDQERRHEQVEKAERALKEAIRYVKDSRDEEFGGRRKHLIERLERLDEQLERDHTRARKALDEAIEDLEYAVRH